MSSGLRSSARFLIYINDLKNSTKLGDFVLFADDTNIFVPGINEDEAYNNAQVVLDAVNNYMSSNQLHINMIKSVYMHFRPHLNQDERQTCARSRIEKSLKVNNLTLKQVTSVKFLGVIIDDQLTWEPHIEHLKTKLNSSIVVIKRIKKFIPISEHINLYNALFKSHISYCIWEYVYYKWKKIDSNLFNDSSILLQANNVCQLTLAKS